MSTKILLLGLLAVSSVLIAHDFIEIKGEDESWL